MGAREIAQCQGRNSWSGPPLLYLMSLQWKVAFLSRPVSDTNNLRYRESHFSVKDIEWRSACHFDFKMIGEDRH